MENIKMPATDAAKVLDQYMVLPVSGEAMVALFEHTRCTHSVRTTFPLSVAHQVALALEHHVVGCRIPGGR